MGAVALVQVREIRLPVSRVGAALAHSRALAIAIGRPALAVLVVHLLERQSHGRDEDRAPRPRREPVIAVILVPEPQVLLHVGEAPLPPLAVSASPRHVEDQVGLRRHGLPKNLDPLAAILVLPAACAEGGNLRLVLQDQKVRFGGEQLIHAAVGRR